MLYDIHISNYIVFIPQCITLSHKQKHIEKYFQYQHWKSLWNDEI